MRIIDLVSSSTKQSSIEASSIAGKFCHSAQIS